VTKDSMTLTNDNSSSKKEVAQRSEVIRKALSEATMDVDREWLQKRLARLLGGVVSIQVGAQTEVELGELKDRMDDALNATRSAVEEGVVPGGGTALLGCAAKMHGGLCWETSDEHLGYKLLQGSLSAPLCQIAVNSGVEGAVVVERVLQDCGNSVYNAQTGELEDVSATEIVDPVKVTKAAVSNAASVAGMLLTTECVIYTEE